MTIDPTQAAYPSEQTIRDCWNTIGVMGDRTCPELPAHMHCHNCPVYASAASALLDQFLPDGEVEERSASFSERKQNHAQEAQSAIVFRLSSEWLALPASCVLEVSEPHPIHSLPNHSVDAVLGVVNIRGELLVCVSLAKLLGLSQETKRPTNARNIYPRLLVITGEGGRLVLPVDEVHGLHRFDPAKLKPLPFTAANAAMRFTTALLPWNHHMVGCLDDQLLVYTVNRNLA